MTQIIPTLFFLLALFSISAPGAVPTSIPRSVDQDFIKEGLFEGGSETSANLEDLRLSSHSQQGFERWVFDFSDPTRKTIGSVAPRFQVQYKKGSQFLGPDGINTTTTHPRFVFLFRFIDRVYLTPQKLDSLVQKSKFIDKIILYPNIEDGDMAVEFFLKKDVRFKPFQPLEREGRLVLDLKSS